MSQREIVHLDSTGGGARWSDSWVRY